MSGATGPIPAGGAPPAGPLDAAEPGVEALVAERPDADARREPPLTGEWVPGYETPVIDERIARTAAGALLAVGVAGAVLALATGSMRPMQGFAMLFLLDMTVRLAVSERWAPTMLVARALVRRGEPQWVGAAQKRFAWWLGVALAATSCVSLGWLAAPLWVTLALCGTCLTLLASEALLGYCPGCALHRALSREETRYCADGSCEVRR